MTRTGYAFDQVMLDHRDPSDGSHPETPERLLSIMSSIQLEGLLERLTKVEMAYEDIEGIPQVHSVAHHERMLKTSTMEEEELLELAREFDSIYLCRETARSALVAVGSTVALAKAIAKGTVENGFAIVRPPGHHAEQDRPMGFCIYNNVAIAAKALLAGNAGKTAAESVNRILILDWDVHHGNGTQNAFIDDPRVLFVSIHRYDNGKFYPHSPTANMDCVGTGKAAGKTVNVPWPHAGFGDAEYLHAFHRLVLPIAREFNPDFVFISAGFDAAVGDPIGECLVTPEGFAQMTHLLRGLAGGRVLVALEGGYNVKAVANSTLACLRVLLGDSPPRLPQASPPSASAISTIEQVVKIQSVYWSCLAPRHIAPPDWAVPLCDLVTAYWGEHCRSQYNFLAFPVLDARFQPYFENRVHFSEDLHTRPSKIVLLAHEFDPIAMTGPSIENNIVSTASFTPAFKGLLDELVRQGVALIDIYVPSRPWKLRQTSAGGPEELQAYNDFFAYIWDTFLAPPDSKSQIYIVSNGLCNYAVGKLIDTRPVEGRIKAVHMLSSTLYLPIVAPEKGSWYQENARVYVPGSGKPLGTPINTAPVYGSCFSAGPEGPFSHAALLKHLLKDIKSSVDKSTSR